MCLRLSHLFRLYPLYLLLAAALLGVDVIASPLPRADSATVHPQRFILLRIGYYDWEQRRWIQRNNTTGKSLKVLCIGNSRCFGYTPTKVIEEIPPKTTRHLGKTDISSPYYRTMKAHVYPYDFDQAQQSLFESLSSVDTLKAAIEGPIEIQNDESCIRAILNLMVKKQIVDQYDDQKSLEENLKPILSRTPSKPLPLRFGFRNWSKDAWANTNPKIQPNFLCLTHFDVCLGVDKTGSKVVTFPPGIRPTAHEGSIDPRLHPPLVSTFDQQNCGGWSDPDQKHRTLIGFLQDIGDVEKAAGSGRITDSESYIRAILGYLSLDSVGLVQGYDSTKPLLDLVENRKRKHGGDGQDSGNGIEADNANHVQRLADGPHANHSGDGQDSGNGVEADNANHVQRLADGPHANHSGDGQDSGNGIEADNANHSGDGQDSGNGIEADNANHVQRPADGPHAAASNAAIHNLLN